MCDCKKHNTNKYYCDDKYCRDDKYDNKCHKHRPNKCDYQIIPKISPWVIPPTADVTHYKLLLVNGQDDEVPFLPVTFPGPQATDAFKDIFNWNDSQVVQLRNAAIAWFIERFGIDFSTGFLDPTTGIVITDFGLLIPLLYAGYYRVLSSNNCKIPPYSKKTPSTVLRAEYTVVFFTAPVYGGTYASCGPIQGKVTDVLSYAALKIFLNYSGTKSYIFFGRAYYPTEPVPCVFDPTRQIDRYQLISPDFGPGYGVGNSAVRIVPTIQPNGSISVRIVSPQEGGKNLLETVVPVKPSGDSIQRIIPLQKDGKSLEPVVPNQQATYSTNATSTWQFPGSHLAILADYNGFTQIPVNPY